MEVAGVALNVNHIGLLISRKKIKKQRRVNMNSTMATMATSSVEFSVEEIISLHDHLSKWFKEKAQELKTIHDFSTKDKF
jgi:hypothetical protein